MTIEIIAEISGNHGGVLENALRLITYAAQSGATGVKFQCFEPERLAHKRENHPRIELDPARLDKLYHEIHTPRKWFLELIKRVKVCDLTWHASVFDPEDVEFLEELDCPRYKIASFEADDGPLITVVKKTLKPVIVSVNQHDDVNRTTNWFGQTRNLTILHATDYNISSLQANLSKLRSGIFRVGMSARWGLSDHTWDNNAAIIAAALGARMIEWHIKLAGVKTPDDSFSFTAGDFALKAKAVKAVHDALHG